MNLSPQGLEALKRLETFSPKPIPDAHGKLQVGYGHNITGTTMFDVTPEEAEELLIFDVADREDVINAHLTSIAIIEMTQQQFDAILIFLYNIGANAFIHSTALSLINRCDWNAVPDAMRLFNKITVEKKGIWVKVESHVLKNRREAEIRIFLKGNYDV